MADLNNFRAAICVLATIKKKILNSNSSSQQKEIYFFALRIMTQRLAEKLDKLAGTNNPARSMEELEKTIDCEVKKQNSEYMKKIIVLDDAEVCSICLQDIDVGANGVAVFKCNSHIFHKECVDEWSMHKPNCPLCRHDMWKEPQRKRKRSHDCEKHKGETSAQLRQKTQEI
ncbi:hypothetical protein MKX03_009551 [Papaver bracteatum]|nr:hypothetical protein MKX03_009551 [Papaver bracteatum]